MSEYAVFTSESVSEGHPDKMADQISDAVVDAMLAVDPDARVAVETLVKTGMVVLAGEITCLRNLYRLRSPRAENRGGDRLQLLEVASTPKPVP